MRINVSLDDGFVKWYNNQNQDLLAIDGISNDDLDIQKRSDIYLESSNTANIAIDENANNDGLIKSPNDHYNQMFAGLRKLKNYNSLWIQMKTMYGAERAIELMNFVADGNLYIHDSSQMNVPYCFSYSSSRIMSEGIYWTDNINIDPPKHHDSFVSQVAEVTIEMSNEFAGAIAIADFLVNYAWYSHKEKIDDSVIRQDFQQFVYTINRKYRSHQPPFVNLSLFDRNNIKALFENYKYPDFTSPMDIIDEVMKVQRIFGEWFVKGDSKGRPFRFPVVTASMLEDKNAEIEPDEEFLNMICEQTYSNGAFNIFNSDSIGRVASCCRLLNDFKLLSGVDSFGNGGLNIGSHKIVAINLPRIGYLANGDTEEFESMLKYLLESAKDILMAHRELIKKRANQGSLKFIKPLNYVDIDKMLFSTIGVVGVFEAARNMGYEYDNNGKQDYAIEFMKDIIQLMRNETDKYIDQYGVGFNLEQVPAESLANKFVRKDKILYGEIEINDILYSNQFIPLTYDMNIHDRMKIDGIFSKVLSGGGITHINLSDKLESPDQMKKLINFAKECGLEHFAIESMISECENNHHTTGNFETCPTCEANIIERYVRVVGYRVPVSSINKIRRKYDIPFRKYKSDES